jgi:hypothetical protein
MERIRTEIYKGREIMITDLSDFKEDEMIRLITKTREIIFSDKTPKIVLAIFNDKNHLTSRLMNHYRTEKTEAIQFIQRQAVVGFNDVQLWILKGYNLFAKRNIQAFRTKEEALEYLVSEH